ncbi:hypothetical protein [Actinoplanes sp. L3-i22]|uniref:hypothetical protein n=1 Tax=Actinoplanes sp. L3-i22 TaxID=2836373 RepID=UPI001C780D73|nr:hypothetical protein [Actinoplanes sp. L3-i22]BCY08322.1 hypothetical protein L3i22_034100 [Actinoplanes sp. L3-i22]
MGAALLLMSLLGSLISAAPLVRRMRSAALAGTVSALTGVGAVLAVVIVLFLANALM